jgi:hypothetical protein
LIDGVSDERVVGIIRGTTAKSDVLQDDDSLARAKDKALLAGESRLNIPHDKLVVVRAALAAYGVAINGALSPSAGCALGAKPNDEEALDKKEQRFLKIKLPNPMDGWKDAKGATIHAYADRHLLHKQISGIF